MKSNKLYNSDTVLKVNSSIESAENGNYSDYKKAKIEVSISKMPKNHTFVRKPIIQAKYQNLDESFKAFAPQKGNNLQRMRNAYKPGIASIEGKILKLRTLHRKIPNATRYD